MPKVIHDSRHSSKEHVEFESKSHEIHPALEHYSDEHHSDEHHIDEHNIDENPHGLEHHEHSLAAVTSHHTDVKSLPQDVHVE